MTDWLCAWQDDAPVCHMFLYGISSICAPKCMQLMAAQSQRCWQCRGGIRLALKYRRWSLCRSFAHPPTGRLRLSSFLSPASAPSLPWTSPSSSLASARLVLRYFLNSRVPAVMPASASPARAAPACATHHVPVSSRTGGTSYDLRAGRSRV